MFEGKKVSDIINKTSEIVYTKESETVFDAGKLMKSLGVGSLLVKNEKGDVTGIITERDLAMKVVAMDKDAVMVRVGEVMTKDPIAIRADASVPTAMQLMSGKRIRHLPVVDDINGKKEIVGMLSGRDILAGEFEELRAKLHMKPEPEEESKDVVSFTDQ